MRLVIHGKRLGQLLEQLPLIARQLDGIPHVDVNHQVAASPALHFGTPLPLTRNSVPLCVPSGIIRVCGPSSVGTLIWSPSTACATLIGTVQCRSLPWRSKICVLFDREKDVEIAVRTAIRARLPFSRQPADDCRRRYPAGTVTRSFLFTWR